MNPTSPTSAMSQGATFMRPGAWPPGGPGRGPAGRGGRAGPGIPDRRHVPRRERAGPGRRLDLGIRRALLHQGLDSFDGLDVKAEGAELLAAVLGDALRAPRRHPHPVDAEV